MDFHQQKQFVNMGNCDKKSQQHQSSVWTEVPRCPHVEGLENESLMKYTKTEHGLRCSSLRPEAQSSSIINKTERGLLRPDGPYTWHTKREKMRGEEGNKIYHEHSQWSVKWVSQSLQIYSDYLWSDLIRYSPWYPDLEHDLNRLEEEIWLKSVQLGSS